MKSIVLCLLFLSFSKTLEAKCYVFIFGGAYHPEKKKLDETVGSKSNEINADASKLGCITIAPVFNSNPETYYKQFKELTAGIESQDKINIAFTDHGGSESIPTGDGQSIVFKDFLTVVNDHLISKGAKDVQLTYTSHICWGGQLHDGMNSFLKSNASAAFIGCGATSVDRENVSAGNSSYNEAQRRGEEYISAGWTMWAKSKTASPLNLTIENFDTHSRSKDPVNNSRGAGTSSHNYLLQELGYSPYGTKKVPNLFAGFLSNPLAGYKAKELFDYLEGKSQAPGNQDPCPELFGDTFRFIEELKPYVNPTNLNLVQQVKSLLLHKEKFADRYSPLLKKKPSTTEDEAEDVSSITGGWELDAEKLKTLTVELKAEYEKLKAAMKGTNTSLKEQATRDWMSYSRNFKARFGDECEGAGAEVCFPWRQFQLVEGAISSTKINFSQAFDDSMPLFNGETDVHGLKMTLSGNMDSDWQSYNQNLSKHKSALYEIDTLVRKKFMHNLATEVKGLSNSEEVLKHYQKLKACERSPIAI